MTDTALKPYPNYQDAGLRWLDRVPAHWDVQRAKTAFRPINVRSETGKEELLTVSSKDGVRLRSDKKVTMFQAESYVGHKLCWPGDLVVNSLWAWAKGLGVSKHHGIISTAYSVYRPRPEYALFADYFHSLLRSEAYDWEFTVRSKGIWISRLQLTDSSFFDMPVLLPPVEEAEQIGRFIRDFDRRINQLIRAKQRLVALLTEQKQAVIQRAVTRGLDPDAPTKPSGVDWLGDVPEHWDVTRLKYVTSRFSAGGTPSTHETSYWAEAGQGISWVMIGDMSRVDVVEETTKDVTRRGAESKGLEILPAGTLLYSMYASVGAVATLGIDAAVNQAIIGITPNQTSCSPAYLQMWLRMIRPHVVREASESTQANLNAQKVKSLPVVLPPPREQSRVLARVSTEVDPIDEVIAQYQREITLIQEYRQRLVADVVTGKLDVRGVAVPADGDRQLDGPKLAEDPAFDGVGP